MMKYRCHKIVEAKDLSDKDVMVYVNKPGAYTIDFGDESVILPDARVEGLSRAEIETGYLVRYKSGYVSWSPREDFEDGYAPIPPDAR